MRTRIAAVVVSLTLVGSGVFSVAVPAGATGTGIVAASPCLTVRGAASASGADLGCIPDGTSMGIDCTITGEAVTGPWGESTLWDHTSYGSASGFVADAWVNTGTSTPTAPSCGGTTREQDAIAWLTANAGSTDYDYLCETMVEHAYGVSGKYATATDDYQAQASAGAIHTDTNAPAGALVFFAGSTSAGHVEIANGDGQYWTSDGTIHLVDLSWGGTYYGWAAAPADW